MFAKCHKRTSGRSSEREVTLPSAEFQMELFLVVLGEGFELLKLRQQYFTTRN